MATQPRRPVGIVLGEARFALGMTQEEFGSALGSSHRTAVRWDAGESVPAPHHLEELARRLYAAHRALAVEAAAAAGTTLVELGLEEPPKPPAPPAPPATVLRAEDLVDVVVLAVVEASGTPPAAVRPLLYAIFKRAREIGLTVQAAEKALSPPVPPSEIAPQTVEKKTKKKSADGE
jgi:transcriptional regulator with XRE-family HTH domain